MDSLLRRLEALPVWTSDIDLSLLARTRLDVYLYAIHHITLIILTHRLVIFPGCLHKRHTYRISCLIIVVSPSDWLTYSLYQEL